MRAEYRDTNIKTHADALSDLFRTGELPCGRKNQFCLTIKTHPAVQTSK